MSEEREIYTVPGTSPGKTSRWVDIRFDDGKHTGVRVLYGTTVIEVRRDGRRRILDIAAPVESIHKVCYDK